MSRVTEALDLIRQKLSWTVLRDLMLKYERIREDYVPECLIPADSGELFSEVTRFVRHLHRAEYGLIPPDPWDTKWARELLFDVFRGRGSAIPEIAAYEWMSGANGRTTRHLLDTLNASIQQKELRRHVQDLMRRLGSLTPEEMMALADAYRAKLIEAFPELEMTPAAFYTPDHWERTLLRGAQLTLEKEQIPGGRHG